jgi:hypothetical protein
MVVCLLAVTPARAAIVYVDCAAPGPTYNGRTWATAYKTIAAAIASNSGNDIYIRTGIYRERLTLNKYTNLYGGFLGFEASKDQRIIGAFPTVIDACKKGRAVDTQTSAFNIIDGLTIKRGVEYDGGGIRCRDGAKVTIRNCRITDCSAANRGGGVYFGEYTTGELTNCFVANCTAPQGGGVVVEYHSYPTLQRSVIVRNHGGQGGGVYCPFHSGALLVNCTVAYNTADVSGGAVYAYYGGPVTLNYCILSNNTAPAGAGVFVDGGSSQTTVTGCCLWANQVGDWGGYITPPDPLAGNFTADPMYLAPDLDEYHLLPGSACANVGAFPIETVYKMDRITAAVHLPDGVLVQFTGKIVGFVDGDVTYVQEPDRASAIAVHGLTGLSRGDIVSVTGSLAGRELTNATATRWTYGRYHIRPLGVRLSAVGATPGLYARTWGRVVSLADGGFVLEDGGSQVDVRYPGPRPAVGDYVAASGVFAHDFTFSADCVTRY